MIIKKEVLWNKDYANDGILYFSQRIVEMLDFRTIDIYRAPVFQHHKFNQRIFKCL